MPQVEFIRDLVVIFGLSVVVVLAFSRLRLPSITGFLISGMLVGPYGLNLIQSVERVEIFAEVGVVLLLFTIGLEFSLPKLIRIRTVVMTGGALQVGLTILFAGLVALAFFRTSVPSSILWGFLMALSSTAIVLKMLVERGELDTPHGRLALAILIFQDLIVVPMMMLLPVLGGTIGGDPLTILLTLGRSLLLILVILIAARWLVPKALEVVVRTRSRELFVITILLICAGIAWFSERNGLSLALGAFIAGLVISESEYSHQALSDIMPFRDSFNSLFFVSIGMLLDGRFVLDHIPVIAGLTLLVLLFKGAVAGGATLALGYPLSVAAVVGLTLSQVGEFSFVLALASQPYGLLSADGYKLFLAISILTMLVTPLLVQLGPRLAERTESVGRLPEWIGRRRAPAWTPDKPAPRDHVIIGGYGLNGRNLARVLKEVRVPYVIVDLHPEAVRHGHAQGEPLLYGDVTQSGVLHRAGIEQARVLVLAVSDPFAVRRAIHVARRSSPRIHIVVRTRYVREVDDLLHLGANEVVPEEFETSLEIFDLVLQQYSVSPRDIRRLQQGIRQEGYAKLRQVDAEVFVGHGTLPSEVEVYYHAVGEGPLNGKTLETLQLPKTIGVQVAAVIRGGETLTTPSGAFRLLSGDTLVLIGPPPAIDQAVRTLESVEHTDGP